MTVSHDWHKNPCLQWFFTAVAALVALLVRPLPPDFIVTMRTEKSEKKESDVKSRP